MSVVRDRLKINVGEGAVILEDSLITLTGIFPNQLLWTVLTFSQLRKQYRHELVKILNQVKSSSAYWNLLKRATNPKVRKNIGPLKKDDSTLEFTDSGKANLMNSYFATIGLKLSNTLPPPTSCGHGITCADKGETDTPRLKDACFKVFSSGQNKGAKNKKIHGS